MKRNSERDEKDDYGQEGCIEGMRRNSNRDEKDDYGKEGYER